jgi:hypothetical protein
MRFRTALIGAAIAAAGGCWSWSFPEDLLVSDAGFTDGAGLDGASDSSLETGGGTGGGSEWRQWGLRRLVGCWRSFSFWWQLWRFGRRFGRLWRQGGERRLGRNRRLTGLGWHGRRRRKQWLWWQWPRVHAMRSSRRLPQRSASLRARDLPHLLFGCRMPKWKMQPQSRRLHREKTQVLRSRHCPGP